MMARKPTKKTTKKQAAPERRVTQHAAHQVSLPDKDIYFADEAAREKYEAGK